MRYAILTVAVLLGTASSSNAELMPVLSGYGGPPPPTPNDQLIHATLLYGLTAGMYHFFEGGPPGPIGNTLTFMSASAIFYVNWSPKLPTQVPEPLYFNADNVLLIFTVMDVSRELGETRYSIAWGRAVDVAHTDLGGVGFGLVVATGVVSDAIPSVIKLSAVVPNTGVKTGTVYDPTQFARGAIFTMDLNLPDANAVLEGTRPQGSFGLSFTLEAIPEPSALALLALGAVAGLGWLAARRRRRSGRSR